MEKEKHLPLTGVRVLELGHTVMGPTCGLILADMGAEVFKVEPSGTGDDTRWLKGYGSGFFTYLNRNKKSVSIDLKSVKGRELMLSLVRCADVVIENFGPGTVERLGVDYQTCQKVNPRLVYCSLKGFLPGPYENRPALDEVVQMMGGLAYMTGPAGRPLRAGSSVIDMVSGSYGAIGILAALYEREQTGRGQLVRASLFESVAFLVGQHMAVAAIQGVEPPPMPERGRSWSIYDLFTTSDSQQIFIAVTSDRHWQRMCATFGFSDWGGDEQLATNQQRIESRDWLIPELQQRLGALTTAELTTLAEKADIPYSPINTPIDLVDDRQMNESGSLAEVRTPKGEMAKLPKLPLRMAEASFDVRLQPPTIGEGSFALYLEAGLSEEEILDLQQQGIITIE